RQRKTRDREGDRPQKSEQEGVQDANRIDAAKSSTRRVAGDPDGRRQAVEERRLHRLVGVAPEMPSDPGPKLGGAGLRARRGPEGVRVALAGQRSGAWQ